MKSKPALSTVGRAAIDAKASNLVEAALKPRLIETQPDAEFNFIVDVLTRWRGSSLYFISVYQVGRHGVVPGDTFEAPFARMQYKGADRFGLSLMRHTGRWVEIYPDLPVDECLESIRDDPFFA
jgi:hypothetical protein